jgi:hypothetical protein
MDKRLLNEMVEDLEQIKRLVERHLRALRAMGADQSDAFADSESTHKNDIKAEIERQRQTIMAQVEQAKAQAMSAAQAARPTGMGSMLGMGMPSGAGMSGVGSLDFEKLKELQQKVAEDKK